jgi:hypothetical protein
MEISMLTHPTYERLITLGLTGMAKPPASEMRNFVFAITSLMTAAPYAPEYRRAILLFTYTGDYHVNT